VSTDAEYHAHRIGLSIPEGGRDWTFGDAFPHEAAYDQLGALDFAKGCYVGQEVVSRMEHRGTARSRVVSVLAAEDLPPPGTPIMAGALPIGTMGSSARSRGIAIARLDRTARSMASGEAIVCASVPVTLAIPGWARYRFPEAQEATP
jgi:folate-binding protein YgfZ